LSYLIYKNLLAPKCTENDNIDLSKSSHMIMWNRCNFRCGFCYQSSKDFKDSSDYKNLSENEFIATIIDLMKYGKNFKFSGGEPTLNPRLEWDLKVVKGLGGTVFLDTNGSNPKIVKHLLEQKLIDVLAISIKGLTKEECLATAEIKNENMCWNNVFESIEYGSKAPNVKVIITHVCYNNFSMDELRRYSDLIYKYDDVFYKINNLHKSEHRRSGLQRVDTDEVIGGLKLLIKECPKWKDHIIYVDNDEGITDYSKILFL